MIKTIKYILLSISALTTVSVQAQVQRDSINREVEVTKAYVPTVSDANKLNTQAEIDQETQEKPTFNYSIKSQPVFSTFSVTPLKAATIETTPHIQKGYGLVRAGVGSYLKPYAEVFFNNVNSKNSVFGIHARHLSSFGKIELEGGDRVDAPFMNNQVELFVKHTLNNAVLSFNADVNHDAFRYYGYPLDDVPQLLWEDNQKYNYFGTKQAFTKGSFHIDLDNLAADFDEQEFGFSFDYHYFGTKTEQREQFANLTFNARQPFQVGVGLLDAGIEYTGASEINIPGDSIPGKDALTVLFAHPAWYIGDEKANIKLGIKTWFIMSSNEDTRAKIAPVVRANWTPVKEIITLYAGLDGSFINNYYSKIAYENPFVNPGHNLKSSMENFRFYGGFDGKFSPKTAFKFSAEYSIMSDKPLYYLHNQFVPDPVSSVPDYLEIMDNTFAVLYDDVNRFKLNAEIFHASSDKLDLLLSINYYNYQMDRQEVAWNLPDWDATFSLGYKVNEQLSFTTDIYLVGKREVLTIQYPNPYLAYPMNMLPGSDYNSHTLDPAFDLNVKGNYQLTSKFSVFAQLNNFGFQQYQRWLGYPVQSFNFLAGISYAF